MLMVLKRSKARSGVANIYLYVLQIAHWEHTNVETNILKVPSVGNHLLNLKWEEAAVPLVAGFRSAVGFISFRQPRQGNGSRMYCYFNLVKRTNCIYWNQLELCMNNLLPDHWLSTSQHLRTDRSQIIFHFSFRQPSMAECFRCGKLLSKILGIIA
jgi:hypothetical protein